MMTKKLTAFGKTLNYREWCMEPYQKSIGLTPHDISNRKSLKWDVERILTQPIKKQNERPKKCGIKIKKNGVWIFILKQNLDSLKFKSFKVALEYLDKNYPDLIFNREVKIESV